MKNYLDLSNLFGMYEEQMSDTLKEKTSKTISAR